MLDLTRIRAGQVASSDESRLETARLGLRRAQEALGVLIASNGPVDAAAEPAFDVPPLAGAPDARFEPAEADGVLPDGFFTTTNLPTYVRTAGVWRRPRLPRMDCVIVHAADGDLVITEPRKVSRGDRVAVGAAEDGSEGILVHAEGFLGGGRSANEFGFMQTAVSREKPVDYGMLAELL